MSGLQILMSPLMGVILVLSAATQDKQNTPAPAKPNYSGIWKLNLAKSDYGPVPAPESQVYTIEHKEPSIKIIVDQKGGARGDIKFTLDLTTDGKEVGPFPKALDRKVPLNGMAMCSSSSQTFSTKAVLSQSRASTRSVKTAKL